MRHRRLVCALAVASLTLAACASGGSGSGSGLESVQGPGAAAAHAAPPTPQLRAPRPLRGGRTLRAPDRVQSLPAPSAANPSRAATPGSVLSFHESSKTATLQTSSTRFTFAGQSRTLSFDTAAPPAIPPTQSGRTTLIPSITYDPVTRTWSWR